MVDFTFHKANYSDFISNLSSLLGVPVEDNRIIFPENYGDGYLQYIKMPDGVEVNIFDFTLKTNFSFNREGLNEDYYTLHFDEFTVPDKFLVQVGKTAVTEKEKITAAAYLTSTLLDFRLQGSPGMRLKGINILFSKEWIARYLKLSGPDNVLSEYFNIKSKNLHIDKIDANYAALINEVFNADLSNPLNTIIIHNRLLLLIELFFTRLYKKLAGEGNKFRIKKEEIVALNRIERLISENYGKKAADIEQLAKQVSISPGRLKSMFKKVNGIPIYEYSQKKRMEKARQELIKGRSVKEVAAEVGYQKLNNFLNVYKKFFESVPMVHSSEPGL